MAALYAVNGTPYELGNSAILLYIASGASDDNAAAEGIELSYTVELPGGGSYGFDIQPYRIPAVVAETIPALLESARYVAENA